MARYLRSPAGTAAVAEEPGSDGMAAVAEEPGSDGMAAVAEEPGSDGMAAVAEEPGREEVTAAEVEMEAEEVTAAEVVIVDREEVTAAEVEMEAEEVTAAEVVIVEREEVTAAEVETTAEEARMLPVPGPRSERVPWRVPSPAQASTGGYVDFHLDPRLLFLGAPSASFQTPAARLLQSLRREALRGPVQSSTRCPAGVGFVRKTERAILPDGTIYELTATWVPDPEFQHKISKGTQTTLV